MKQCYKFTISGRVQGVYYRKSVAQNAQNAGFIGYVKNLPNKDVEAVALLDDDSFNTFMQILQKGSMFSSVKEIKHSLCNEELGNDFEIRY